MKTIILTAKMPRTPSFFQKTSFLFLPYFHLGVLGVLAVGNGGL